MNDVKMCPSCAKEMEYDSFSGRYVCAECGRSEAANTGVDLHVSVPRSSDISSVPMEKAPSEVPAAPDATSTPIPKRSYTDALEMPSKDAKPSKKKREAPSAKLEASFVPSTTKEKDEPAEILRSFYKEFECASIEEVLFRAEDSLNEENLNQISNHPLLNDLSKAQPRGSLSKNIIAYCDKVHQLIRAEEMVRDSQKDLEDAEKYVQKLKEHEARTPKIKLPFSGEVWLVVLAIPLFILLTVFFDDDHDTLPLTKENISLTFKFVGFLYAIIFVIVIIMSTISVIKNSSAERRGNRLLKLKNEQVNETIERALKLQDEKEQILKSIRTEEALIREKYIKRNSRSMR